MGEDDSVDCHNAEAGHVAHDALADTLAAVDEAGLAADADEGAHVPAPVWRQRVLEAVLAHGAGVVGVADGGLGALAEAAAEDARDAREGGRDARAQEDELGGWGRGAGKWGGGARGGGRHF